MSAGEPRQQAPARRSRAGALLRPLVPRTAGRDNFAYLTVSLVAFLLLTAAVQQFAVGRLGEHLVHLAALAVLPACVWIMKRRRHLFAAGLCLAAGFALLTLLEFAGIGGSLIAHGAVLALCLALAAGVSLHEVLASRQVDANAVAGAICVYLLAGLLFAMLFLLVEGLHPGSFRGTDPVGGYRLLTEMVYLSFVTITTVGFGDIVAVSPLARTLVYLEGVFGQFYIAIFVASLIGIRVSRGSGPR